MKKLKILIGGGIREIVHIKSTGGGGIFSCFLGYELAKRGHEVSILGLEGSFVEGCSIIPVAPSEEEVMKIEADYLLHDAYQLAESQYIALNQNKYDIIHISYYHYLFAPLSKFVNKPVIYTEHLPLLNFPTWQQLINKMNKDTDIIVFPAKHMFEKAQLIKNKICILHGINTAIFPFSETSDNYLFWIGRTKKKKGLSDVIQIILKTGFPLYAAQATKRPDDIIFFNEEIKPLVKDKNNIHFLGIQPYPEKVPYYQKAKAFLFPVQWEEPFGLTMAESMACGTPVITYARGAVPEIIKDGETGFIVNPSDKDIRGDWIVKKTGIDGLCEAVERIYAMPEEEYKQMRKNCRAHVEKNFTVERMVDEYEKLYEKIIEKKAT